MQKISSFVDKLDSAEDNYYCLQGVLDFMEMHVKIFISMINVFYNFSRLYSIMNLKIKELL